MVNYVFLRTYREHRAHKVHEDCLDQMEAR